MSQRLLTGRQARGPSVRPPTPNVPNVPATTGGPAETRPLRAEEVPNFPDLPDGARQVGWVRIPLALGTCPRAYLYELPGRPPVWFVRLPSGDGTPRWCALSPTEPVRWGMASHQPRVVRRALLLLRRVRQVERASPTWEVA